ncbi:Abi family protein, partial [Alkalibacter mobilis]|uniref:Abi family protein n=1 Tax=Alkalibacter mobilis TaxID=2787712 RepID=UPI00189C5B2E
MADKYFKNYQEQIKILQSRGLTVEPDSIDVLKYENYYNVINGYKDLFLQNTSSEDEEIYIEGAEFNEIYALYEFDRNLRFIFLKKLLIIENNMKSVMAYRFSEKYGHDNYIKLSNFNKYKKNKDLDEITNVMSSLQRVIYEQCGKNDSLTHYYTNYGYVPF